MYMTDYIIHFIQIYSSNSKPSNGWASEAKEIYYTSAKFSYLADNDNFKNEHILFLHT